jgi:hypothetical protein
MEIIASLLAGGEVETLADVKKFVAWAEQYEMADDTKVQGQLFVQMVGEPAVAGGYSDARVIFVPGQPPEDE